MTDFTIVDSNDNPIGAKHRQDKQYDDIYRVAALWLTDSITGDVLLAQRKWTKKNNPGKWAAAVSGTVEPNETYEINIVKEIEEEIGLTAMEDMEKSASPEHRIPQIGVYEHYKSTPKT